MIEKSFGIRFGYLRWLWFLRNGESPGFADIGRAVGRTGPAVGAWMRAKNAPTDYQIIGPLVELFGLPDERWIMRGEGTPPEPELFAIWLRHRRADLKRMPGGGRREITRAELEAEKKKSARRGA